ncbi:MAG: glutathione S-transferase N-terminal domain-containing protein [Steroidobacteraceae bacterium]
MKLIGTYSSPFVRKVRIVAAEHQLPLEIIEDPPLGHATHITAVNPLGKVPVLVRDDGKTLIDSSLICAWLDQRGQGERLLPAAPEESMAVQQAEAIADGIMDAAVLIRMEMLRPEPLRSSAWVERQSNKIQRGIAWLDTQLARHAFVAGESLTLADIAAVCANSYLLFRFADQAYTAEAMRLEKLCTALETRASFAATALRG